MFKEGDLVTNTLIPRDDIFIIIKKFGTSSYHCKNFTDEKDTYIYSMSSQYLSYICDKKQGIFDMFKDYM